MTRPLLELLLTVFIEATVQDEHVHFILDNDTLVESGTCDATWEPNSLAHVANCIQSLIWMIVIFIIIYGVFLYTSAIEALAVERAELDAEKQRCAAFKKLACEKGRSINTLRIENEELKIQMESQTSLISKLEETQQQEEVEKREINERNIRQLKGLEKEIEEKMVEKQIIEVDKMNAATEKCMKEMNVQFIKERSALEASIESLTKDNVELEFEEKLLKKRILELDQIIAVNENHVKDMNVQFKKGQGTLEETIENLLGNNFLLLAANTEIESKLVALGNLLEGEQQRPLTEGEQQRSLIEDNTDTQRDKSETGIQSQEQGTVTEVFEDYDSVLPSEKEQKKKGELNVRKGRFIEVALSAFRPGDAVFIYYDSASSRYQVANRSPREHRCLVHASSLSALGLDLMKSWSVGKITRLQLAASLKDDNIIKKGEKLYLVCLEPLLAKDADSSDSESSRA